MDSAKKVIAYAKQLEETKELAESLQYHISQFTEAEQEKFERAIAQLNATQLAQIQQIVIEASQESKSMKKILNLIADYLAPQPEPIPVFSLAESPITEKLWLVATFGTFTPTQYELIQWQQRHYALERLKSVGKEIIRGILRR